MTTIPTSQAERAKLRATTKRKTRAALRKTGFRVPHFENVGMKITAYIEAEQTQGNLAGLLSALEPLGWSIYGESPVFFKFETVAL